MQQDMEEARGGDEKLFVRFSVKAKENPEKSQEAGRPVHEDAEWIEIVTPGDKTNKIDRPLRDDDKRRFPRQYAAFKSGNSEQLVGTPLAEWPPISRSQVADLAYFGVRTVEQLAGVSDGNITNLGPIRQLQQKAKDFLEAAKGGAPASQLRAELEKRDATISAQAQQIKELAEAVDKLQRGKQK